MNETPYIPPPPPPRRHLWNPVVGPGRWRALMRFVLGVAWFKLAEGISAIVAAMLMKVFPQADSNDLLYRTLFQLLHWSGWLALLVIGFTMMGMLLDDHDEPFKALGLVRRTTAVREWAVGAALGWGLLLAAVLPMALGDTLRVSFWGEPRAWIILLLGVLVLVIAALTEEVAFRGYLFQRLIEAVGPMAATLMLSVYFALMHIRNPNATLASTLVTLVAGILFSIAYLRTRALWLPWGMHMAWNLSMGVLLGLPVSGILDFNTVIQTNAYGPRWLTGGSYGPEGAWVTLFVLLGGIIVLMRVTQEYSWAYAHPPIVAAGYAVEVAPPAAHVEMENKPAPAVTLVQIAAVTSQDASLHSKDVLPELPKASDIPE